MSSLPPRSALGLSAHHPNAFKPTHCHTTNHLYMPKAGPKGMLYAASRAYPGTPATRTCALLPPGIRACMMAFICASLISSRASAWSGCSFSTAS